LADVLVSFIYISATARRIFNLLDIEPLPVKLYTGNNCYYSHSSGLYFGLEFLLSRNRWDRHIFNFINSRFKNRFEKLTFVVAHEIGHYMQDKKFPTWYSKYAGDRDYKLKCEKMDCKKYRKLKLERYADRIAVGICKRLKIISA
jgi:hypothetical protein